MVKVKVMNFFGAKKSRVIPLHIRNEKTQDDIAKIGDNITNLSCYLLTLIENNSKKTLCYDKVMKAFLAIFDENEKVANNLQKLVSFERICYNRKELLKNIIITKSRKK